ncbi:hypothetical protein PR202_ga17291 [Eleusine coracana subsp. coracana]|uniref:FBD domain-containing protein n=1 Tax=Eleusine coracana subsp. coracana TaxID=191504 RepID=A0AAV5CQ28_ELECO|nr:hypothetical protein PR202_ga17291 [Eleusine coracana subsp. coracana]
MIIRCPILECLLLKKSYGFDSISINSNTLVSIGLDLQNVEIIIEDAPKLEKLLQLEPCIALRISVISAPKLDTLGCLSACDHNSKLAIGTTVIQELHDVTFTAMVCSVKALSISIQNLGGVTLRIDTIINLMRCFPCLQKLYIQVTSNVKGNWCHHEHPNVVRCLDISLKEIILQNYQATESQINLATFFILNAKKLEIMKFQSRVRNRKKSITEQKQLLQLEKRASTGARFQFLICKCDYQYPLHIKHVGDLSKADPFECIC